MHHPAKNADELAAGFVAGWLPVTALSSLTAHHPRYDAHPPSTPLDSYIVTIVCSGPKSKLDGPLAFSAPISWARKSIKNHSLPLFSLSCASLLPSTSPSCPIPTMVPVTSLDDYTKARALLASTLFELGQGGSFWFVISEEPRHRYSLANQLGFHNLPDYYAFLVAAGLAEYRNNRDGKKILRQSKQQWEAFLVNYDLSPSVAEHTVRRFDLQALVLGEKQVGTNRKDHHVLRIGQKSCPSYTTNISLQKDKGGCKLLSHPPVLPGLRSFQRKFSRQNQQIIANTIINNDDLYDDIIARPSATPPPTTDVPVTTPSPPKRAKHDKEGSPSSTFSSSQFLEATGAITLPSAEQSVVSYKDTRNHRMAHLVRIPQNLTDNSFMDSMKSRWLDSVLEINGRGDTFHSTKRMAKYLKRRYSKAFDEFLQDQKLGPANKMSEAAVAAMFTAGGVTGRHQRRAILRTLRHHFGKAAFASERRVKMLCQGATQIFSGSVNYAYESGGIKETISFTEKDIAREVESQLAVSVTM